MAHWARKPKFLAQQPHCPPRKNCFHKQTLELQGHQTYTVGRAGILLCGSCEHPTDKTREVEEECKAVASPAPQAGARPCQQLSLLKLQPSGSSKLIGVNPWQITPLNFAGTSAVQWFLVQSFFDFRSCSTILHIGLCLGVDQGLFSQGCVQPIPGCVFAPFAGS